MKRAQSALAALLAQPGRFRFDSAVRVLMRRQRMRDPGKAVHFRSEPGRAFAHAEVTAAEIVPGAKPRLTIALIGLIGAGGVLPRLYEVLAAESLRRGSEALQGFLDMLAQRMIVSFAQAGIKYRLHRSAEHAAPEPGPAGTALLAFTGYATPGLVERLAAGPDPLLHYAGLFAMWPRSADRLEGLIADWLERPVSVEQFAGHWLVLPADQQTALPDRVSDGAWNRLGVDAAVGDRCWDVQGRIRLRIGPLDAADFAALLPDQATYRRLVSLVRAYLGLEVGFAINPVLSASARAPLVLHDQTAPRLGWTTWITPGETTPRQDAADAIFDTP